MARHGTVCVRVRVRVCVCVRMCVLVCHGFRGEVGVYRVWGRFRDTEEKGWWLSKNHPRAAGSCQDGGNLEKPPSLFGNFRPDLVRLFRGVVG